MDSPELSSSMNALVLEDNLEERAVALDHLPSEYLPFFRSALAIGCVLDEALHSRELAPLGLLCRIYQLLPLHTPVRIEGLASRQDLNGCCGTVAAKFNAGGNGRVPVRIAAATILIRPQNLRLTLCLLQALPSELLGRCLGMTRDVRALARLESTCRQLRSLSLESAEAWRVCTRATWPMLPLPDHAPRDMCRSTGLTAVNWLRGRFTYNCFKNTRGGHHPPDEWDQSYFMGRVLLAADAQHVVMGCDESAERGKTPEQDPLLVVCDARTMAVRYERRAYVTMLALCGGVYAYSCPDVPTRVCFEAIDASLPSWQSSFKYDLRDELYAGAAPPRWEKVTCLAGRTGMLLVGTASGHVVGLDLTNMTERSLDRRSSNQLVKCVLKVLTRDINENDSILNETVALCFAPDGESFISASAGGSVQQWGLDEDRSPHNQIIANEDDVCNTIAHAVDGEFTSFPEWSNDTALRVARPSVIVCCARHVVVSFESHVHVVFSASWPRSQQALFESSSMGIFAPAAYDHARAVFTAPNGEGKPCSVANGLVLVTSSRFGVAVCVWSPAAGTLLYRLEHPYDRRVTGMFAMQRPDDMGELSEMAADLPSSLVFGRDCNQLLLATTGGTFHTWDFSAAAAGSQEDHGLVPYTSGNIPRSSEAVTRAVCWPQSAIERKCGPASAAAPPRRGLPRRPTRFTVGQMNQAVSREGADLAMVRAYLADGGDVQAETAYTCIDDRDGTLVHLGYASMLVKANNEGLSDIFEVLLQGRADPDYRDTTGNTPLLTASGRGDTRAVRALLLAGASVGLRDTMGETALERAVTLGQTGVVAEFRRSARAGLHPSIGNTVRVCAACRFRVRHFERWPALASHLCSPSVCAVPLASQMGVTPPPNPTLSVGMRVKARFMASSKGPNIAKYWFQGTIRNIHTDGTCDIDCE